MDINNVIKNNGALSIFGAYKKKAGEDQKTEFRRQVKEFFKELIKIVNEQKPASGSIRQGSVEGIIREEIAKPRDLDTAKSNVARFLTSLLKSKIVELNNKRISPEIKALVDAPKADESSIERVANDITEHIFGLEKAEKPISDYSERVTVPEPAAKREALVKLTEGTAVITGQEPGAPHQPVQGAAVAPEAKAPEAKAPEAKAPGVEAPETAAPEMPSIPPPEGGAPGSPGAPHQPVQGGVEASGVESSGVAKTPVTDYIPGPVPEGQQTPPSLTPAPETPVHKAPAPETRPSAEPLLSRPSIPREPVKIDAVEPSPRSSVPEKAEVTYNINRLVARIQEARKLKELVRAYTKIWAITQQLDAIAKRIKNPDLSRDVLNATDNIRAAITQFAEGSMPVKVFSGEIDSAVRKLSGVSEKAKVLSMEVRVPDRVDVIGTEEPSKAPAVPKEPVSPTGPPEEPLSVEAPPTEPVVREPVVREPAVREPVVETPRVGTSGAPHQTVQGGAGASIKAEGEPTPGAEAPVEPTPSEQTSGEGAAETPKPTEETPAKPSQAKPAESADEKRARKKESLVEEIKNIINSFLDIVDIFMDPSVGKTRFSDAIEKLQDINYTMEGVVEKTAETGLEIKLNEIASDLWQLNQDIAASGRITQSYLTRMRDIYNRLGEAAGLANNLSADELDAMMFEPPPKGEPPAPDGSVRPTPPPPPKPPQLPTAKVETKLEIARERMAKAEADLKQAKDQLTQKMETAEEKAKALEECEEKLKQAGEELETAQRAKNEVKVELAKLNLFSADEAAKQAARERFNAEIEKVTRLELAQEQAKLLRDIADGELAKAQAEIEQAKGVTAQKDRELKDAVKAFDKEGGALEKLQKEAEEAISRFEEAGRKAAESKQKAADLREKLKNDINQSEEVFKAREEAINRRLREAQQEVRIANQELEAAEREYNEAVDKFNKRIELRNEKTKTEEKITELSRGIEEETRKAEEALERASKTSGAESERALEEYRLSGRKKDEFVIKKMRTSRELAEMERKLIEAESINKEDMSKQSRAIQQKRQELNTLKTEKSQEVAELKSNLDSDKITTKVNQERMTRSAELAEKLAETEKKWADKLKTQATKSKLRINAAKARANIGTKTKGEGGGAEEKKTEANPADKKEKGKTKRSGRTSTGARSGAKRPSARRSGGRGTSNCEVRTGRRDTVTARINQKPKGSAGNSSGRKTPEAIERARIKAQAADEAMFGGGKNRGAMGAGNRPGSPANTAGAKGRGKSAVGKAPRPGAPQAGASQAGASRPEVPRGEVPRVPDARVPEVPKIEVPKIPGVR